MKIFAQLYDAHPVEPIILLKEYRNVVWKNVSIREKMHEPYICKSNYAILLAAAGQIRKALLFLKDIVDEKKKIVIVYMTNTCYIPILPRLNF